MGTTADKLTYLNNTKIAIKNELNKLGAEIEDSDTFRSYANALESIYSEYPTVDDIGSSIVLNKTKKAPLKSIALNSTELTQDGTPTPSSPLDVNVIKGENTITISNSDSSEEQNFPISLASKNLFDFSKVSISKLGTYGTLTVENNEIKFTATGQNVYGIEIDLAGLNLKSNTTYTVSNLYEITGSFGLTNGWRYYNGSSYTTLAGNKKYFIFTTTESGINKLMFYLGSPTTFNGTLTLYNIQLLEGNIAEANIPTYEPYYNIEYCKIGNYKDQISNQFESKNLANYLDIPNAPQWGSYFGGKYIEITGLKPNTQYTMSSNVPYNSNGQIYFKGGSLSNRVYLNNNCTQTSDANGVLFFGCFTNREYYDEIINGKYYIQLEEGDTATEYMPYGITKGEWYLKKNIGKVVLDGSETYTNKNITDNNLLFSTSKIDNLFNINAVASLKSNRFIYNSTLWDSDSVGFAIFNLTAALRFRINKTLLSDVTTQQNAINSFKSWLSQNNVNVYYVLATPTYTQISQEDYPTLKGQLEDIYNNSKSYNEVTNINQTNDDLPFNISVSALLKGDI